MHDSHQHEHQHRHDHQHVHEDGTPCHCGTDDAAVASAAIDPVCGMTVEIESAHYTATYMGTTYHFCSSGCRERFLADPTTYAVAAAIAG